MIQRLVPIYSTAWRAMIALFTIEISVVSVLKYFTDLEPPPPPVVANAFADPFLVIHIVASIAALLAGPIQFVGRIRSRWPAFHRATGYLYVTGCMIGAPAGFVLALGTTAGPVAGLGFAIPAVLCPIFTWFGWRAIVERRIGDHRDWMLRSYAVIATAITLRLMLPASAMMGLDFFTAYPVIAWLGWMTNLAIVEYWIRRRSSAGPTLAAA